MINSFLSCLLKLKLKVTLCCRYIFPGLALGAALGQTGVVTNAMINKSAEVSSCCEGPH